MKMCRLLAKILLLSAIAPIVWYWLVPTKLNQWGTENLAIAKNISGSEPQLAARQLPDFTKLNDWHELDDVNTLEALEKLKLDLQSFPLLISQSSRQLKYKLQVRQLAGRVLYQPGGNSARVARIGDTLQNIGDRLITGAQSGAVLRLGETIAQVEMAADTELVIRNIAIAESGGLVSQITLRQGMARFRVPDFLNPDSNMYVSTPAAQISLRGADFLIGVNADGKTTVSVWRGSAIAKGTTNVRQTINAGFYSLIFPGVSPTKPAPISNNIAIRVENVFMDNARRTHVVAQVAPENAVFVANKAVITDDLGRFRVILPPNSDRRFVVTVSTPLGNSQTYNLAVPVNPAN
jgi:hypothetical protein